MGSPGVSFDGQVGWLLFQILGLFLGLRLHVEYIHLNPVKAELATRPEDWPWSSVHDYSGNLDQAVVTPSGLSVDRVLLPVDQNTRI